MNYLTSLYFRAPTPLSEQVDKEEAESVPEVENRYLKSCVWLKNECRNPLPLFNLYYILKLWSLEYRRKSAKKISHDLVNKSSILIISPKEGLKMSVHTDFQHDPLKNKARRRVWILENWGFLTPPKKPPWGKKNSISRFAVSKESEPWEQFLVSLKPNVPRMVSGSLYLVFMTFVGPISFLQVVIAFESLTELDGSASIWACTDPDDIYVTRRL